jgi:hypothetical protein
MHKLEGHPGLLELVVACSVVSTVCSAERPAARQRERQRKRRGSFEQVVGMFANVLGCSSVQARAGQTGGKHANRRVLHSTVMAAPLKMCENVLIDAKYHSEHAIGIIVGPALGNTRLLFEN